MGRFASDSSCRLVREGRRSLANDVEHRRARPYRRGGGNAPVVLSRELDDAAGRTKN